MQMIARAVTQANIQVLMVMYIYNKSSHRPPDLVLAHAATAQLRDGLELAEPANQAGVERLHYALFNTETQRTARSSRQTSKQK